MIGTAHRASRRRADPEVIILGGGPAGAATALALAKLGVTGVLMVEAGHYATDRVGESIPPDTRLLLAELGVWEAFLEQGHEPCLGSCSAWGEDTLGYNDFLFNPLGHGWHLDRRRFDRFLSEMARENGVTVCEDTKFLRCDPAGGDGFSVTVEATGCGEVRTIPACFVVDAMGMRSGLAQCLGATRRVLDRLICVYGIFEHSPSHDFSRLTVLEAAEYGWWYAARLPGDLLVVAVASDPETIKHGAFRGTPDWLCRLRETHHLGAMISGRALAREGLRTYPALSFMLDRVAGDGWLAVGDSASSYDPISSQGIDKALADGLSAAGVIVAHLAGDARARVGYQSAVAERFDDYLTNRNFFYAMERRWPRSMFWRRRQQRTSLP